MNGKTGLHKSVAALLGGAALLAACATSETVEHMTEARVALADANGAGAGQYAPAVLKSAADKMDAAERAMASNDYVAAQKLAEEAAVEARLAAATARAEKAQQAANAVQENLRILREEIERKTP
jgi:hypothetical protein